MADFEPKIIAFLCNWCSYAGADKAGGQKLIYPDNIKLIRVMCSGRVDPEFVMGAFRKGADGVMVLGCHPGDCHYKNGNIKTLKRMELLVRMLEQMGMDRNRFKLDWVAAGESEKFQRLTEEMVQTVRDIGPLAIKGFVQEGSSS